MAKTKSQPTVLTIGLSAKTLARPEVTKLVIALLKVLDGD